MRDGQTQRLRGPATCSSGELLLQPPEGRYVDLTDVQLAMARSYRHQLPGTEVRHEQAYHHHRSQEAVPGSDHAARCYVEGRG